MNVLINLLSSGSGGALSYVRNLIPRIAQEFAATEEHTLILLLNASQKVELSDLDPSVECIEVAKQKNGYARVLWERFTLSGILKEHRIDVLFTPYQMATPVKDVKTVVMIRNMEPFLFDKYQYDFKNRLRNVLLRKASIKSLKSSSRIIAVSEYAANYCLDALQIPQGKLTTIYHGRDQRFSPERKDGDNDVIASLGITADFIFTCGSMLPYRRCELIIAAFDRWAADKHCELVIAGSSNDNNYKAMITALIARSPVAHKIKWLGHVNVDAMRVLYRNCKLFVTTTEIEACPNIAIEAMSSGCSIISSGNEPLPEIFKDAATYCHAEDSHALAKQFELHFSSNDGVNRKALHRAEQFSWEICSRQTFETLTNWSAH